MVGVAETGNRLLDCADFQWHVHLRDKSTRQAQAVAANRLESGKGVGHLIRANWQRRKPVIALRVGDGRDLRDLQRWTRRRDRDAGKDGSTFICYLTDDARGCLRLGRRAICADEQTEDQNERGA
jgi:hypothetical protein